MISIDPKHWRVCEGILDRLHEFLNRRELTPADEEEIRQHLKACPPCGDRFEFEELLLDRLRKADPCRCPDSLRARVQALLNLE
ncbi:MAG: zf-HC2 domain-containing protein [Elusimicrobia bacterium]|nr:zf-HC2 domain-containing protein [Elusimicrobiota bacterium]